MSMLLTVIHSKSQTELICMKIMSTLDIISKFYQISEILHNFKFVFIIIQ